MEALGISVEPTWYVITTYVCKSHDSQPKPGLNDRVLKFEVQIIANTPIV